MRGVHLSAVCPTFTLGDFRISKIFNSFVLSFLSGEVVKVSLIFCLFLLVKKWEEILIALWMPSFELGLPR